MEPQNPVLPHNNNNKSTIRTHEETRKLLQQQLFLIFHSQQCIKKETQFNHVCPIPHCNLFKSVLIHLPLCKSGYTCELPHCGSSKILIEHWENCINETCSFCSLFREIHVMDFEDRKNLLQIT